MMTIAPAPPYPRAEDAEAAFYAAFESRNMDIMRTVWSHDNDVLCIHPMGQPITGWLQIESSWTAILENFGQARFELSHRHVYEAGDISVRYVHENIHHGPGFSGLSVVLASNVFRRQGDGWRMVTHHASPGGVVQQPASDRPMH